MKKETAKKATEKATGKAAKNSPAKVEQPTKPPKTVPKAKSKSPRRQGVRGLIRGLLKAHKSPEEVALEVSALLVERMKASALKRAGRLITQEVERGKALIRARELLTSKSKDADIINAIKDLFSCRESSRLRRANLVLQRAKNSLKREASQSKDGQL